MSADDLKVALATIEDLTTTRARAPLAELRAAAELKAALTRCIPAIKTILATASTLDGFVPTREALALADAINGTA